MNQWRRVVGKFPSNQWEVFANILISTISVKDRGGNTKVCSNAVKNRTGSPFNVPVEDFKPRQGIN